MADTPAAPSRAIPFFIGVFVGALVIVIAIVIIAALTDDAPSARYSARLGVRPRPTIPPLE